MTTHVFTRGFYDTNLEMQPYIPTRDVSDDIQQTLDRLLGWYDAGKYWQAVQVDNTGRLLTSPSSVPVTTGTASQKNVTTADIEILAANSSRNYWIIKNFGSDVVYVTLGVTALTTTGYPLSPGDQIGDTIYKGSIRGIAASGTQDMRIIEV